MACPAPRMDEVKVDSNVARDDTEERQADDQVDLLTLALDLKEVAGHKMYEAQLEAISRAKMLYENHFGYLHFVPV